MSDERIFPSPVLSARLVAEINERRRLLRAGEFFRPRYTDPREDRP